MKITNPYTRLNTLTEKIKLNDITCYVALLLTSVLQLLFYSTETSPLFNYYGVDAPMFETIGKYWSLGYLPYVDLWDSKGPFIFFINMLGYSLTKSLTGIFIMEVIAFTFTLIFLYKILNEKYNKLTSLILSMICLPVFFFFCWDFGNTVTGFNLPFIACSTYLFYKFYNSDFETHPWKYSIVHGLSVGVCVLSRPTDALMVCLFYLLLCVILIKKKQFKLMFKNILTAFCSFVAITLPFVLYFYFKGALKDMFYAVFTYNFTYYTKSSSNMFLPLVNAFGICLFIIILIIDIFKKNFKSLFLLIPILTEFVFLLTSNGYRHYYLIFIPATYIFLAQLCNRKVNILLYLALIFNLMFVNLFHFDYRFEMETRAENTAIYDRFLEGIETDSFLAVDTIAQSNYLKHNLKPNNKFFELQTWAVGKSKETRIKALEDFIENEPEYLLVQYVLDDETNEFNDCVYQKFIDNDYEILKHTIYKEVSKIVLYRLKK